MVQLRQSWCASCIRQFAAGVAIALLIGSAGCSRKTDLQAYSPSNDVARRALDAALTAWQQGQAIGTVESDGLKLSVEDYQWRAGGKLQGYEVVEQVEAKESPPQFRVQLRFVGVPAPVSAIYFVIGREPIFVCRDYDYTRLGEM